MSALETLQAEHLAADAAAAEAAAVAAQVLAQAEAHKTGLEGQIATLTQAAQEHASYQQELEGKAKRPAYGPALCILMLRCQRISWCSSWCYVSLQKRYPSSS